VVAGEPADRAGRTGAHGRGAAVPRLPSGVRRLHPALAAVEGEIDPAHADAGGELIALRDVVRDVLRARLLIDVVVRPGDEDVRLVRVDRDRGLVLVAPGRDGVGAAAADLAVRRRHGAGRTGERED